MALQLLRLCAPGLARRGDAARRRGGARPRRGGRAALWAAWEGCKRWGCAAASGLQPTVGACAAKLRRGAATVRLQATRAAKNTKYLCHHKAATGAGSADRRDAGRLVGLARSAQRHITYNSFVRVVSRSFWSCGVFLACCGVVLVFQSQAGASALSKFIQDAAGRVSERRAARLPAVTSSDSVACAEPRSGDQSRLTVCLNRAT